MKKLSENKSETVINEKELYKYKLPDDLKEEVIKGFVNKRVNRAIAKNGVSEAILDALRNYKNKEHQFSMIFYDTDRHPLEIKSEKE